MARSGAPLAPLLIRAPPRGRERMTWAEAGTGSTIGMLREAREQSVAAARRHHRHSVKRSERGTGRE
jgi:hypothetical protein